VKGGENDVIYQKGMRNRIKRSVAWTGREGWPDWWGYDRDAMRGGAGSPEKKGMDQDPRHSLLRTLKGEKNFD